MVEPIPFPGPQRQKQTVEEPKTIGDILEALRTRNAGMRKAAAERRERRNSGKPENAPKPAPAVVPAPVGDRQALPLYVQRVIPFEAGEWRSLAFFEVEGEGKPGLMARLGEIPLVDQIDVTARGVVFRVVDGPKRDETILAVLRLTLNYLGQAVTAYPTTP